VSTTLLSFRTHSTVVPCIGSLFRFMGIRQLYPSRAASANRVRALLFLGMIASKYALNVVSLRETGFERCIECIELGGLGKNMRGNANMVRPAGDANIS